jgi:23S rRNA (uracil1939-C5)-methyltransferase
MVQGRQRLVLQIEKPVAGGRMLARHDGQVILTSGAIPGERVLAELEPSPRRVTFARTVEVLEPHSSRRPVTGDPECGGNLYAHIDYPEQLALKSEILRDAFARIARQPLEDAVHIASSPERGYRMRARLHAMEGKIGFIKEGTHTLCEPSATGQLLPATLEALTRFAGHARFSRLQIRGVEMAENIPASERSLHVELQSLPPRATPDAEAVVDGVTGLSVSTADSPGSLRLYGEPGVADNLETPSLNATGALRVRLRRHTRSFFQGNRFLLPALVERVLTRVPPGPVVDLFSGVGLFAVPLAAGGWGPVVAVEGHTVSARDLKANAAPYAASLTVVQSSVEDYLARGAFPPRPTVVVDPPRTGLSRDCLTGVASVGAGVLVYVSCDPATLARDVRALGETGYRLTHLEGFDLFPNTPHVETLAILVGRDRQ